MRLDRLTLENFGPFRSKVVEFAPGLNMLVGPNGSGKTTVVEAAHGALTGDFRLAGTAADNLNRLAKPKDPCRVELAFSHGNRSATLRRSLSPSSSRKLAADGLDKPLTADKAVASWLADLLGFPLRTLSEYVFVKQWGLADFLDLSETRRSQACSELFGLGRLERVYRALSDRLARSPRRPAPVEAARAAVAELEEQVRQSRLALESDRIPDGSEKVVADALENLRRREAAARDLDDDRRKLAGLPAELNAALTAAAEAKVDLGGIDAEEASLPRPDDAHRVLALQDAEANHKEKRDCEATILDADACAARAAAAARPAPPFDDAGAIVKAAAGLASRRADLERIVRSADRGPAPVVCPTCGQPAEHLRDRLEAAKIELESMRTLEDGLAQAGRDLAAYETSQRSAGQWANMRRYSEQQLAVLAAQPVSTAAEKAAARDALARWSACRAARATAERRLAEAEAKGASIGPWVDRLSKHMLEIEAALAALPPAPPQSRQELEELLNSIAQSRQRQAHAAGRLQVIERSLEEARLRLAEAEADGEAAGRDASWRSRWETLREVFHPNGLPRRYSEIGMKRLAVTVNRSLAEDFQSPFQVEVGGSLELTARYGDGRDHPASRLSGGQQAVLALSLRLAVLEHFAAGAGLLVLDEPTAGLDRDNRQLFGRALERLRSVSQSTGLQVILVSHDEDLAHLFDRVVRM